MLGTSVFVERKLLLGVSFGGLVSVDKAIEETAAHCKPCKTTIAIPKPVAQHPWQLPNGPWERVYVDQFNFW